MTALQRRILVGCVMIACLMQTLDTTIAIVALPHMQGSMSATPDQISWVLTSYIVATAMAIPTSSYFSQRFGRKNVLLFIVFFFSVTSVLCGMAQSLEQIVFFRILQGICGAYFMPISQTVILDNYPVDQRAKMLSLWTMVNMFGPIIGPALGGYLTETLSWRWVFYINLPIGILTFIGLLFVPQDTKRDPGVKFRWEGYIYLAIAIGALQLMLDRGNMKDWFSSTEIRIEGLIALVFFYLFLVQSFTSTRPFMNFELFKDRNVVVAFLLTFISGSLLYATMSLMPPFLQTLLGYPVVTAGLVLAPRGLSTVLALLVYARFGNRVDPRVFLVAGIIISTYSLWMMKEFDLNVSPTEIAISGFIQGFGLGTFFGPLGVLGYSTLAPRLQGEAAQFFSLVRNLGSSIGISVAVAFIVANTQVSHSALVEHIHPTNPLLQTGAMPHGLGIDSSLGLSLLDMEITRQATAIAYLNDFRALMWLNLLCALSLFFFRYTKKQPEPVKETPSHAVE